MNSKMRQAKKKAAEKSIMLPFSPKKILAFPTPTTQVEDLFLPYALVILAGEPKCGKTTLTADMLCAIQCGVPWKIGNRTLEVQQGQVVYITKEGKGGWQARMKVLEMKYGNLKGFNDMIWFFDAPMLDDTEEGRQFLLRSIDALGKPPSIIAYDNLSRLMTGDENTAQDTAPVVQTLDMVRDRYKCTNFLLHHTGLKEKKRPRGSSNLPAAADTVIVIQKKSLRGELISKLSTPMQRDLPPIEPINIQFRTVEIGTDKNGKTITALTTHFKKTQPEQDGQKMLSILEKQPMRLVEGSKELSRMAGLSKIRGQRGQKWLLDTEKAHKEKSGKVTIWSKIDDETHR